MRLRISLAPLACVAALAWLVPGRAHADDCTPLLAVSSLSQDERTMLHQMCRTETAPPAEMLHATVMKLMTAGNWQIRALHKVLLRDDVRRVDAFSVATAQYQRAIQQAWGGEDLDKMLARKSCEPLRTALNRYMQVAESGKPPAQGPFRASVLARAGKDCQPAAPDIDLLKFNFITIDAEDIERVSIAAVTPSTFYYNEIAGESAFTFAGKRMLLVVVPRNAYSMIAVHQANLLVPKVLAQVVPADRTYTPADTINGCVTLDVRLNTGSAVFLDGLRVEVADDGTTARTNRILLVPEGEHTLTVVRPGTAGSTIIEYDEKFTVADDVRCVRLPLDLRRDNAVGLLGVFKRGECAAEVTESSILALIRAELRHRETRFVDMDAQKAFLASTLSAAPQASPIGQMKDWSQMLQDVARTNWRRGFDRLLFFQVQCDRFSSLVTRNRVSVYVVDRNAWSNADDGGSDAAVRTYDFDFDEMKAIDEGIATLLDSALGTLNARFVRGAAKIQTGAVDYFWSATPPASEDEIEIEVFEPARFAGRGMLRRYCRALAKDLKTPQKMDVELREDAPRTRSTLIPLDTPWREAAGTLGKTGGQGRLAIEDRYLRLSWAVLHRPSGAVIDEMCIRPGRMRGGMAWFAFGGAMGLSDHAVGVEFGHVWRLNHLVSLGGLLRYSRGSLGVTIENYESVSSIEGYPIKVTVYETYPVDLGYRHSAIAGAVLEVSPTWQMAPFFRTAIYAAGNVSPDNIRPFHLNVGATLDIGWLAHISGFMAGNIFRIDLPALDELATPHMNTVKYRDDLDLSRLEGPWGSRIRIGLYLTFGYNWGQFKQNLTDRKWFPKRRKPRR